MLEHATCYKSGSALRDRVTRVIIVLFVGGQATNGEQNKPLTTDFSAHKNVDVWLFLLLL